MLDVLGDGFIAQHVAQRIMQESRERLYRRYITDALFCISNRTESMVVKWSEIDPGFAKPTAPEDPKEIRARILRKINE